MLTDAERVAFGRAHPEMTLQQLAAEFGLSSRQRVRQVFAAAGYEHPMHWFTGERETRTCAMPECGANFEVLKSIKRRACDAHLGKLPRQIGPLK